MENGFIILSRDILQHEIFASEKLLKVWVWCLCKASYKDRFVPLKSGKGQITVNLKRGQFIFGRHKAEEELFIDGSTIYKAIQKLEKIGSILIESNNQYSIVSICNYDSYQTFAGEQVTSNEQPTSSQVTTTEQASNNYGAHTIQVNEGKQSKKERKQFAPPTILEVVSYFAENGYSEILAKKFFDVYDVADWCDTHGKKIKNWKQKAITTWFKGDNKNTEHAPANNGMDSLLYAIDFYKTEIEQGEIAASTNVLLERPLKDFKETARMICGKNDTGEPLNKLIIKGGMLTFEQFTALFQKNPNMDIKRLIFESNYDSKAVGKTAAAIVHTKLAEKNRFQTT